MIEQKYVRISDAFFRNDGSSYKVGITSVGASQVSLISHMTNPEALMTKVSKAYLGIFENVEPSEEEIDTLFADQQKTKLNTPLEMLYFVFLVKYVSRAFTHQMVRTRIASYAQQSMRFLGAKDEYYVHIPPNFPGSQIANYFDAAAIAVETYEMLIANGTSSEQARGVLPTNILTDLYVGIPLSSLKHVYEQRMCCQAQPGEWQDVIKKMRREIRHACGTNVSNLLSAPYERGESCGYRASYDRPCIWRKDDNTLLDK